MPPKAPTTPSVRCLKYGEILIDENRRLFFLCTQCSLDFLDLQAFREHLKNCDRVRQHFKGQVSSKLNFVNGSKLLKKVRNHSKELIIYGFAESPDTRKDAKKNGNLTDLLSIEQELLDPRWYTDTVENDKAKSKKQSSYNDLIEEVTPFVHFKENVKANTTPRATRVSVKEAAKEQRKSIENVKKTTVSLASPAKLYLSDDKKQIQRRTEPAEGVNKPKTRASPAQTTKAIPEKRSSRTVTKAAAATADTTKIEKEKIILPNAEKVTLKRKARSIPLPKEQNNESDQTIKKRRTVGQEQQTNTQPQSIPVVKKKPKEPKETMLIPLAINAKEPKETMLIPLAINASTVRTAAPPKQNTIVLNKKDNKAELETQKPATRRILNNKQLPSQTQVQLQSQPQPQKQKQTQITLLAANPNPLQKKASSAQVTNITNNQPLLAHTANTIIIKEEILDSPPKVTQPMPPAVSNPIIGTVSCHPVQETTCTTVNNNKQTEEILNKLQTLGLKVQRTNPIPEPKINIAATSSSKQALEIIKKLQSKGMNVKIVQKPNTVATKVPTIQPFTTIHEPILSVQPKNGNTFTYGMTSRNDSVANSVRTSKPNFRNNILIKKCT